MTTKNRLFKHLDYCLLFIFSPLYLFFYLFPRKQTPPKSPKRILITKLCCFGDSVLTLLAIKALKQKYKDAEINLLASKRNSSIYEHFSSIDNVFILPLSGLKGLSEFLKILTTLKLFFRLRKNKFDTYIDFDLYYRFTTILPLLYKNSFSIGFNTQPLRGLFFHCAKKRDKDREEWLSFFDLLEPFQIQKEPFSPIEFNIAESEKIKAESIISKSSNDSLKVGILSGSSQNWPEKIWPVENFVSFMKKFNTYKKASYFLFGTKEELIITTHLDNLYSSEGTYNLCGSTNFPLLVALISKLDLFVSNDTGPMHLAALLGIPVIGIFGPTNEKKWSPPGKFYPVTANCSCRPCYYLSSMEKCTTFECLKDISPDMVLEKAKTALKKSSV